ncbi:hypothetical protein CKA32_001017 [Geitlerinema sp. FC II]|nr:hypothetical protein CKA32_001017 [Geitlerinema sp. FC II]
MAGVLRRIWIERRGRSNATGSPQSQPVPQRELSVADIPSATICDRDSYTR